jgi:hypothetical protein
MSSITVQLKKDRCTMNNDFPPGIYTAVLTRTGCVYIESNKNDEKLYLLLSDYNLVEAPDEFVELHKEIVKFERYNKPYRQALVKFQKAYCIAEYCITVQIEHAKKCGEAKDDYYNI